MRPGRSSHHPEPNSPGEAPAQCRSTGAPRFWIVPPDSDQDQPGSPGALPYDDVPDEALIAALVAGEPEALGALYDRHAMRFPDSALAEERAAGRVMALCALARADAHRELRAFEAKYPHSPLLARLDRACGDAQ